MTAPLAEDDIIARYFAPIAGPGALGLRDDAALITPPENCEIILTKDALVASVHFFADDPAAEIARKALRVNVSDLAAKGADPLGFLLALAMPADVGADWLADFARGLGEDSATFDIPLLGGDTVKTPGPLTISITALGSAPLGRMVARTGARAGDRLYVSGTIGDAAIGLQIRLGKAPSGLATAARAHLLARYLTPQPRHALRLAMRDFAGGGMDVSDGLVGDLAKMMRVSGVSARVRLANVPLSDAAREAVALDAEMFGTAVTGGDDYELLASVAQAQAAGFEAAARAAGVAVTWIGDVVAGDTAPVFLGADGAPRVFARGSFSHF